jgi:DNA-binding NarL/FixJ family response regulator
LRATRQPVKLIGMDGRTTSDDALRRISILVAEDNDLYRRGLVSVLADRGFAVLGSTAIGADAVRMTSDLLPDVVLLDLVLADGDSIPRIAEILEAHPGAKVVVLSSSSDRDSFLRSLRAGAAGFLSKDQSPPGLERALHGLLRGEAPISRVLTMHLVDEVRREDRRREIAALVPDRDHLTPRQLEILRMLAGGATTVGIATELYLSVETVRWHIKSILRKLGVRSRADAIACLEELQAV